MYVQIDEVFKSDVKGYQDEWFEGDYEVGSIIYIEGKPFLVIAKRLEIEGDPQSFDNIK